MEYLISQFIDEELSLAEKATFISKIRNEGAFYDETLSLIEQEKGLRKVLHISTADERPTVTPSYGRLKPIGLAVAATLAITLSFLLGTTIVSKNGNIQLTMANHTTNHRFILYTTDTQRVEIAGSFTRWERRQLTRTGPAGYWEITLPVPDGEHRYTFILDGSRPIPDPTVAATEADDFGTKNSIVTFRSTTS